MKQQPGGKTLELKAQGGGLSRSGAINAPCTARRQFASSLVLGQPLRNPRMDPKRDLW
jgi:hypothetical protein